MSSLKGWSYIQGLHKLRPDQNPRVEGQAWQEVSPIAEKLLVFDSGRKRKEQWSAFFRGVWPKSTLAAKTGLGVSDGDRHKVGWIGT